MSNFLLLVKRLRDAALDLYHATERRQVPVEKSDLLALVEDWGRLDSAYRSAHLELISLKAENEALRKDAERYRFIRSSNSTGKVDICVLHVRWAAGDQGKEIICDHECDERIDFAMAQEQQP